MDPRLIAFQRLLDVMDDLREKCPWDKKQTFESLRHLTIEESYELTDAILENDMKGIQGELGDLFLHLVFYCKLGSEIEAFDVSSVLNQICDKLIFRHPHIYSDVEVADEEEVKRNWEKLKLKEGKKSIFEGVPNSLPAMVKAQRIQEKARGIGFDWEHPEQVWEKVKEELDEFEAETDKLAQEEEFGDLLFSMINYARFVDINPENALAKTNQKFIRRFTEMEKLITKEEKSLSEMNLSQMDVYWEKAKVNLKKTD